RGKRNVGRSPDYVKVEPLEQRCIGGGEDIVVVPRARRLPLDPLPVTLAVPGAVVVNYGFQLNTAGDPNRMLTGICTQGLGDIAAAFELPAAKVRACGKFRGIYQ